MDGIRRFFVDWLIATRSYSFPASIVPVLLGSCYAYRATGNFNWTIFGFSMLAGMLYHSACNLLNDYFDYLYGVDRIDTYGGSGMLTSGRIRPSLFLSVAIAQLIVGTTIGLYLVSICGTTLLFIGIAALFSTIFYTASKKNAKYNGFGEILVFVMMGVLMVVGGFLTQSNYIDTKIILVSLPVAFMVTAILQANDTRDIADDRASGITTVSTIIGHIGARIFYSTLLAASYISLLLLIFSHILPFWCLIAVLTIPSAWKIHSLFFKITDEKSSLLLGAVERTAKLHLVFGLLISLGIIFS